MSYHPDLPPFVTHVDPDEDYLVVLDKAIPEFLLNLDAAKQQLLDAGNGAKTGDEMRHVVALSGGKDSTAMALWLAENEPRAYQFVCTPTGDELPEMVAHWLPLGTILGSRILPVTAGVGLSQLIAKQTMLPNHRARWCTRLLKIEPYYRWLAQQAPAVSYVDKLADESDRQGMAFPEGDGITVRCSSP